MPTAARAHTVAVPDGSISVTLRGEGPPVLLVPGCGRPATDLDPLAEALAAAGYLAASVDYRGAGRSTGHYARPTLHAAAADLAAVIDDLGAGPAVVIGHALGNRVARCLAADAPERVRAVVLLAAGGKVPPVAGQVDVWRHIVASPRALPARVEAIADAFFAPGHDPSPWLDWEAASIPALMEASAVTPLEDWWTGGAAPMLVVQGAEDRTAPVANGEALRDDAPGRVALVTIPDAGHALLPEQPTAVIDAVLGWLADPKVPAPRGGPRDRGLWPTEAFLSYLGRRSAPVNAGFLLPHIRSGDRVLDCGCGPGSITRGLAAAARPGPVVGLDLDRAVLDRARAADASEPPIRWVQGGIERLPFADGAFDVVFAHTVLMHLDDPLAALRECRRVLAPGGRVAVVDGDWGGDVTYPTTPALVAAAEAMKRTARASGMDIEFGRKHRGLLHAAGFEDIAISVHAELVAGPAALAELLDFQTRMIEFAMGTGRLEPMYGRLMITAWRRWAEHPGAVSNRLRFEALGRKPI